MRQLTRPKFWIFFVLITLITAFVFAKVGEGESVWRQGLLTGLQMNFRAVVIIVGFSALGTELYNPAVRNFFMKTSFRNLPLAVELSVESLPDFIATIPDFKSLVKNPVSIFYKVLSHAGSRLSEIKAKNRRFFIVTGGRGKGKTTFTKKLIDLLKENRIKVAGILAERIMEGGETTGYDIMNIETGDRECFLSLDEKAGNESIGKYTLCPKGISYGKSALQSQVNGRNKTVVIDEIGMLELRGGGWSDNLDELVNKSGNHLLMVVRDEFVEQVKERWKFSDAVIFNINESNPGNAGAIILKLL
jgi:nucleoside-triphosphatase THEP1